MITSEEEQKEKRTQLHENPRVSSTLASEFSVNTLQYYALRYLNGLTEDDELRNINMTETLYYELVEIPKKGELLNINVNGLVTSGKSTVAAAITKYVLKKAFNQEMNTEKICRDQHEFSRLMRQSTTENTMILIDEWSRLEDTGENITAEEALNADFSALQAQRFVHRVACSPEGSPDVLANIQLEVISADKKRQITHCYLYYKVYHGGQSYLQLLGYVNIDVSTVLNEPWYLEYRKRKFEKMELITKEGIFKPRLLEYAGAILQVKDELHNVAEMGLLNRDIISNYVKKVAKERKIPMTILGNNLMTNEINGILSLYVGMHRIKKRIKDLSARLNTGKMDTEDYNEKMNELSKVLRDLNAVITSQENELQKMSEIDTKYNTNQEQKEA